MADVLNLPTEVGDEGVSGFIRPVVADGAPQSAKDWIQRNCPNVKIDDLRDVFDSNCPVG